MRNELIDLYKLACANPQDKDIVLAYQQARDRIGPQIVICEVLNNDAFRSRFANWQDDINAVLKQRDDLHFRVARLEEALKFILYECDWEETKQLAGGDNRIGTAARRALEEE